MAKQVKIKDIAQMAGVSAGTVDRILHNRGNVSRESREAVERVLAEVDYKYNIHSSAISLRKEYNIVISIPTANRGEYWGSIQTGIEHATNEFSDINIHCHYAFYNQFDIYSCKAAFDSILDYDPDAVIIGPTFIEETVSLCGRLDKESVPYVFVDSVIDSTSPVATFTTGQSACGLLIGKLLHSITPEDSELAIFRTQRIGNRGANNTVERRKGFIEYFSNAGLSDKILESSFSVLNPEESESGVLDFISRHKNIKGIAVMNSRGFIISDILGRNGIDKIKVVSFDLTSNNIRCIENGSISALLCQRPELQGFLSIKAVIRKLIYNHTEPIVHHTMPIDIIMKENLPFYREYIEF